MCWNLQLRATQIHWCYSACCLIMQSVTPWELQKCFISFILHQISEHTMSQKQNLYHCIIWQGKKGLTSMTKTSKNVNIIFHGFGFWGNECLKRKWKGEMQGKRGVHFRKWCDLVKILRKVSFKFALQWSDYLQSINLKLNSSVDASWHDPSKVKS